MFLPGIYLTVAHIPQTAGVFGDLPGFQPNISNRSTAMTTAAAGTIAPTAVKNVCSGTFRTNQSCT